MIQEKYKKDQISKKVIFRKKETILPNLDVNIANELKSERNFPLKYRIRNMGYVPGFIGSNPTNFDK